MTRFLASLAVPLGLVVLWQASVSAGIVSPILLPAPAAVAQDLQRLLGSGGDLWRDIGLTLFRTISALAISAVVGIPLGLAMGASRPFYSSLSFTVDFFRSIPPTALFPLFILFFGLGELSRIAVPVYSCLLVIIVNSVYGVLNAPRARQLMGTVFGLNKSQSFFWITLPGALPHILSGLRIAVSLSLVLTIVVEMFIGSNGGLGKRVYDYHLLFDSSAMFAVIGVIGVIGYALNGAFVLAERRVAHWADK